MDSITVKTWTGKCMTLSGDTLYVDYTDKRVIPVSQIVSFDITKEPKSSMRPGMIVVRLAGTSGTRIALTSFLAVGGSNNIEFPHAIEYAESAHIMQKRIAQIASCSNAVRSEADELSKYKKLLDDGVITQAEFDAKKKQLLGI